MQPIIDLKPGDRLVVDWGTYGQHHIHVSVDTASGYIWAQEYPNMGTQDALYHIDSITNTMGRFG